MHPETVHADCCRGRPEEVMTRLHLTMTLNNDWKGALRAAGLKLEEIYPLTDEKMKIVFSKFKEFKTHVSL
jgi:hypothetical protein